MDNELDLDTIKTLFKQAIDESDNMSDAFQKLFNKIYEKGKEDSVRKEIAHASQKDGVM